MSLQSTALRALVVGAVVFAVVLVIGSLHSCATAPQSAGVVGGVAIATGTFLHGLTDIMAPFLPPEKVAELQTIISSGQDTLTALAQATKVYATEIANVKAQAAGNIGPGTAASVAVGSDVAFEVGRKVLPPILGLTPPAAKA